MRSVNIKMPVAYHQNAAAGRELEPLDRLADQRLFIRVILGT